MHRLPVPTAILESGTPALPPDAMRHLKVLRPRQGERIRLFDGAGAFRDYEFADGALSAAGGIGHVARPAAGIVLFACVTKGGRWDWTIEKAVELGAAKIVPVLSERCVVKVEADARDAKTERWRRVALDAARQSDAAWLPEILPPLGFSEALALAARCGRVFAGVLSSPPPPPIWSAVEKALKEGVFGDWGLFTGPEGDFSPSELAALSGVAEPVSFGDSVLRAETAVIFALSVLSAALHAQGEGGRGGARG